MDNPRGPRVAALPVGSFEQHGGFIPLDTDTLIARAIAGRLRDRYGLFELPPLTISCSHEHAGFPGVVSISARTLAAVVTDVAASLRLAGMERLVLVNAHGGNHVLWNVVQEANVAGPRMDLFPLPDDWRAARRAAGLESPHEEDLHAGETEVSILLHTHPEVVGDLRGGDWPGEVRPYLLTTGMRRYTAAGVIGRPSLATAEKGRLLLDSLIASFARHLDALNAG
jgi:creatinine amidohydrolase